jgi:hypothetical protein
LFSRKAEFGTMTWMLSPVLTDPLDVSVGAFELDQIAALDGTLGQQDETAAQSVSSRANPAPMPAGRT